MITIQQKGSRYRVSFDLGLGASGGAVTARDGHELLLAIGHRLRLNHRCGPACPVRREEMDRAKRGRP